MENLKDTGLDVDTTNQLSQQMIIIQNFFDQQITLVDNGNIYEAKMNLNQGKNLVDKFRIINNILLNKIELDVNSSRRKS